MRDVDEAVPFEDPAPRLIEENMWRAIRFGMDGRLIDLARAEEYPAREAIERLLAWTAPVRGELAIDPSFPERNGAQRQRQLIEAGATLQEVFAASVIETTAELPRGGNGLSTQDQHGTGGRGPAQAPVNRPKRSCAPPTRRSSLASPPPT